jgi:hypothetical protein
MEIKPLAGLTRVLRVLFLVYLGVAVLTLVSSAYTVVDYSSLAPDAQALEMRPSDSFALVMSLIGLVSFVSVTVAFLMWVYRASTNLRALSGRYLRFTPGWAVGWWFIPFASLVMPYKVVREIWQVSHGSRPAGHTLVKWWWAAFLLFSWTGNIASRVASAGSTADSYVVSGGAAAVAGLFEVAAAVITIVLIAQIGAAYGRTVTEPQPMIRLAGLVDGMPAVVYGPPPGWYRDPWGRHELRFWDAVRWSPYVIDDGVQALDPV